MKIKQILSSLLAATMLLGSVTANAVTVESKDVPERSGVAVETVQSGEDEVEEQVDSSIFGLPENIEDGAILHAWSWSFDTIYNAIPDIAAAGYTAVQTSPASKCYDIGAVHGLDESDYNYLMGTTRSDIFGTDGKTFNGSGGAWWWYYQPVKLEVGNYALGTRAQYQRMCKRAHKYGVKIITDIVANHTTAHYKLGNTAHTEYKTSTITDGIAVDPEFLEAVGGADKLYHTKGDVDRTDRTDRDQIINYKNGGLPDINTENPLYQAYLVEYMNDLISLGCDGFRFDTARNIGVDCDGSNYDFWKAVTGQKTIENYKKSSKLEGHNVTLGDTDYDGTIDRTYDSLFYYGENLDRNSTIDNSYLNYIRLTDSTYGSTLRSAVSENNVTKSTIKGETSSLRGLTVTWVESHDDYCGDKNEKPYCVYKDTLSNEDINLMWAILTARNVGTPLYFSRPQGSNATENDNYWGIRSAEHPDYNKIGAIGNNQFKNEIVIAANKFRNAMVGENEYLRDVASNVVQIDRGIKGSCIVNFTNSSVSLEGKSTNLADGNYFDFVSNTIITVSNGEFEKKSLFA